MHRNLHAMKKNAINEYNYKESCNKNNCIIFTIIKQLFITILKYKKY